MQRNDNLTVIYAVVGAICLTTGMQLLFNYTAQESAFSAIDQWLIKLLSGFSLISGVSLIILAVFRKLKSSD